MSKSTLKTKVLEVLASNPEDYFTLPELAEVLLGGAMSDPKAYNALRRAIVALDLDNRVKVRMVSDHVSYGHQTQNSGTVAPEAGRVRYVPGNRGGHSSITPAKDWED